MIGDQILKLNATHIARADDDIWSVTLPGMIDVRERRFKLETGQRRSESVYIKTLDKTSIEVAFSEIESDLLIGPTTQLVITEYQSAVVGGIAENAQAIYAVGICDKDVKQ